MLNDFKAKLGAIWNLPDLKKKVIYTLLMILVVRVGALIPTPGINTAALLKAVEGNELLGFLNMFSGGAFAKVSIFALGVIPYINASIVMQLLTMIYPPLEEMQKEGDQGRQKIVQWTRYLTVAISAVQAIGFSLYFQKSGYVMTPGVMFVLTTAVILTAGTVFLMWLGEQITINGVGNGISLIICLNIIARLPATGVQILAQLENNPFREVILIVLILFTLVILAAIVAFYYGQRRIPIQYVGKGMENSVAGKTYLPLKVNTAGVMPIIFASVIMTVPMMLVNILPASIATIPQMIFKSTHPVYWLLYATTVIFFTFFYTALMFDPEKVAENLKRGGGTVPGIRPGEETVDYLENVVTRITVSGAIFLAIIAVVPMIVYGQMGLPVFLGGTAVIIIVGVILDTIQQIDSQLVMRDYKGFI